MPSALLSFQTFGHLPLPSIERDTPLQMEILPIKVNVSNKW